MPLLLLRGSFDVTPPEAHTQEIWTARENNPQQNAEMGATFLARTERRRHSTVWDESALDAPQAGTPFDDCPLLRVLMLAKRASSEPLVFGHHLVVGPPRSQINNDFWPASRRRTPPYSLFFRFARSFQLEPRTEAPCGRHRFATLFRSVLATICLALAS